MSGIMYKNRPYAGGGGAGGASALSDLTDTSISNPANGQVLKYNNGFWENDDESGGTTVVANPQGMASADLEKLQVGNNIYGIPQGTNVVANPTGTPTEELSTIQIGQDIYEIVGGGESGGDSYEYTQLYTGATNPETMTLNDDISNYDVIYIRTANTSGYSVTALFRAQDLIDGIGQNVQFGIANDSEFFYFRVTSQTLFTRFSSVAQFPVEIGGIKFGGGSGGSGIAYGYDAPTDAASDGNLFILLNEGSDKERGKYLYMNDTWKLISGSAPSVLTLLDSKSQRNYSIGSTLYTATSEIYLLVLNLNNNSEANTVNLTSTIDTDGTVVYENLFTQSWSSPNRNTATRLALVHLYSGNYVRLENTYSGSYTCQVHAIWGVKSSFVSEITDILRLVYVSQSDNSLGTSQTYLVPRAGLYFAVGFELKGNGDTNTGATVTIPSSADFSEQSTVFNTGMTACDTALFEVDAADNVIFGFDNITGYTSRGYAVYSLKARQFTGVLYDNGIEEVPWTVSGGAKNVSDISLNVGGGTYTNYAVIDNPIDLTDYNTLHVECRYRSRDYNLDLDISNYTGSKYISFTYLTDTSHNEAAIGITDTKTGAATIRIDSRNGDTAEQLLYYMSLS